MENKYVVFQLNEEQDSYEQLTYPISSIDAKSYLDRVCNGAGCSYMIAMVVEYKHINGKTNDI